MGNSTLINRFQLFFVIIVFMSLTTLSCAKDNYEFTEISEYSDSVIDITNTKHIYNLFQIIISEKVTIHEVIKELKREKQISNSDLEDNLKQHLFIVLKKAARRNDTLDGFLNDLEVQNIDLRLVLDNFQIKGLYKNIRKSTFLGYVDSLPSLL